MKQGKGIFISFEGGEGCGKTTQMGLLSENLKKAGRPVVVTREPGGTAIGEKIRPLLVEYEMCPETELLLFAASRAQLVREFILPSINENKFVLCDRFFDSTTIYQGVARRLVRESVEVINRFAVEDFRPDLTLIIDIPPNESLRRIKKRNNNQLDRIERENLAFYNAVREGYLRLAKEQPERCLLFDGLCGIEELSQHIWKSVNNRFLSKE